MDNDSGNLSILFLDDEAEKTRDYVEFLQLDGHRVTPCRYIEDFVELLKREKYDVIIMDVMIPQKPIANGKTHRGGSDFNMYLAGVKHGLPPLEGRKIPIIILTNVPISGIQEEQVLSKVNIHGVYQKVQTPPSRLATIVNRAGMSVR
ncbi:MAG: response regulator [bacterium]|nr:response regulator [bacterium]